MRRRPVSLLLPVALLAGGAIGVGLLGVSTGAPASAGAGAPEFTQTKTVTREHLVSGVQQPVDSRTISLSVSQTSSLRGRQEVRVSWTGAHPTGGIVSDPNSIDAQQEEYPMVLLECRGVDSSSAAVDKQLSPQTCWTQSWSERYQDTFNGRFPSWRMDQYASIADRSQVTGAPSPSPTSCANLPAPTQHWIPFLSVTGATYWGGPSGCGGQAPESDNVGHGALPSNETYATTGTDGTGAVNFDVWTAAENASLGCSTSVPCSLVAVPIMGISCDSSGSLLDPADRPKSYQVSGVSTACQSTGNFAPGQLVNPQGNEALSVSGSLWWSASNWRNRITVPLSFAVPASACATVSSANALDIYGSELMAQATEQWAPHFCLDPGLFPFSHVQTGEPQARNLIDAGTANVVLTSEPQAGGYARPVVSAPVGVTGFAISYVIDGADGKPYTSLKLTPRLLAKLLTESYPAELPVHQEFTALANNPLNITLDPEFIALNPGLTQGVPATQAASELVALSSNSDVIHALTSYINADPTARAWLDGTPDEHGMVVNPEYKGISLPVDAWPLLSSFEPKAWYASDNNDCLYRSPVPYLPLVAAPLQTLAAISQDLQFSSANSTTVCSQIDGTTLGEKLVAMGRQTVGYRFMIGITPLADTNRYLLQTAALQTTPGSYVGPTDAAVQAALSKAVSDPKTGTWTIPYDALRSDPTASGAYPGTMVVYAAAPTQGLTPDAASQVGKWISFASTDGQTPGFGVGQIPPGYLPMTAANGLGNLQAAAAAAVAHIVAQDGYDPGAVPVSTAAPALASPVPFQSAPLASPVPLDSSTSGGTPVSLSLTGATIGILLGGTGALGLRVLVLILVASLLSMLALRRGRRRGVW